MPPLRLYTRVKTRWFYALWPFKAGDATFSILLPLFLATVMQADVGIVGLLTTCSSLAAVIGSMFWGYLTDRHHRRRRYIVLGCVGSAACLFGMAFARTVPQMALLCLGYGLFSIAPAPISSVLIMGNLPRQQWDWAFGHFNKIAGWGWVGGLMLGMVILPFWRWWFTVELGMRLTFGLLAALVLLSAGWAHRTIPEPVDWVHRYEFVRVTRQLPSLTLVERALYLPRRLLFVLHPASLPHLRLLLTRPLFRYYVITLGMFVSFTMALTPFPLYLRDVFSLDDSLIFGLVMVRALASVPCYGIAAVWTHRAGPRWVLNTALLARLGIFSGFSGVAAVGRVEWSLAILVLLNIITGVSWALISVSGPRLVGECAGGGHPGQAMGVYNAVMGGAQILGALLGGLVAQSIGYGSTYTLAATLLIPAIAALAVLRLPSAPILNTGQPDKVLPCPPSP